MTISIIIPVFNTEAYLPACVDSILSQSFSDFEVLLIDDGSTDRSGSICDEYAQKDSRILVIHKNNAGVSSARNTGLDNANGEWVFFIDSDDLLPDNALEKLIDSECYDIDMVYGGIRKFDDKNDNVETILVDHKGTISLEDVLDGFVAPLDRTGDWHRYMINRIYRLSIINKHGLRFNTKLFYKEDGLFLVQYLCRCRKKIMCVPDIVYLYRQTNYSATGSLKTTYNAKLLTNVDSHGLILRELKHYGISKDLRERETREIIRNFYWITSVMKQSGCLTRNNEFLLFKKIVKNAGVLVSFRYLVFPRFCSFIKRCLS